MKNTLLSFLVLACFSSFGQESITRHVDMTEIKVDSALVDNCNSTLEYIEQTFYRCDVYETDIMTPWIDETFSSRVVRLLSASGAKPLTLSSDIEGNGTCYIRGSLVRKEKFKTILSMIIEVNKDSTSFDARECMKSQFSKIAESHKFHRSFHIIHERE